MPDEVEKMLDTFYNSVFDLAYDMYVNADLPKNEIKAILGLDVRNAVDQMFKDNFD